MLNKNTLLYGHEELPPAPLALRAGALTMLFEPDNAFLRYIQLGGQEIIRNIYAAVRDQNWNTIPWQIRNLNKIEGPDSFEITFDVDCVEGSIRYSWHGTVTGTSDSRVSFKFEGEAKSDFLRNRIGICVLHPVPNVAGMACTLEHTDGTSEQASFPEDIAPWQPLRDVRAITTGLEGGLRAELRLEGDVFETEDQRNYGDASFKTYSTPQDLPKPVQVRTGDRVTHVATLTLRTNQNESRRAAGDLTVQQAEPARLSMSGAPADKPKLGLQVSRDGHQLTAREAQRIRDLRLAHLRGDIHLGTPGWRDVLSGIAADARSVSLPLHLGVHMGADPESELGELVAQARDLPSVAVWIIQRRGEGFPSAATMEIAGRKLSALGGGIPLAAAASPFFTEMNRSRPAAEFSALACFPCTPQVHLSDRYTLAENTLDVTEMLKSAASFLRRPALVSPITLRRAEPKTGMKQARAEEALPNTVDPRQMSVFGAAWTLGHLAALCKGGHLHSATYYETVGWRGVMEQETGSPIPSKFFSIPGAVFPLYHIFADLAEFDRTQAMQCTRPLQAAGLTVLTDKRRRTLIANLSPAPQEIIVETRDVGGAACKEARVRRLNAATAEEAMRTPEEFRNLAGERLSCSNGILPLRLSAYEVVRADWN